MVTRRSILLARPFLYLPIKTEVALRLPAVLAYLLAALTVYWFVRCDTSRIFALFSMGVFLCSRDIQHYSIEARAYSLLMAFTGVVVCCWRFSVPDRKAQRAGRNIAGRSREHLFAQYGVIYANAPAHCQRARSRSPPSLPRPAGAVCVSNCRAWAAA